LSIATFDNALAGGSSGCDLEALTFVDAYGLVGTACAMRAADAKSIVLPAASKTRRHLSTMGLRTFLIGMGVPTDLPLVADSDHPDVVVPLRAAESSTGAHALSNLLWEQLAAHVSPQVLNAIAEGVWEMVANALEHSGTDALIMGQVYRCPPCKPPDHDDRVQVVIGDAGRGIRESFLATGVHSPGTDLEAITLALEYLVSSVDDPGSWTGIVHNTGRGHRDSRADGGSERYFARDNRRFRAGASVGAVLAWRDRRAELAALSWLVDGPSNSDPPSCRGT
jgi:hypothetical protein